MKNVKFYLMIFILFFCFAINVNAETTPLSDVTYNVPKDTTVKTYSNYFVSNVYDNSSSEIDIESLAWGNGNNFVSIVSNTDDTQTDTNYFKYNSTVNLRGNWHVNSLTFRFNDDFFPLEFGKKYSILFRIVKSKDITFHSSKNLDFESSGQNEKFTLTLGRKSSSNTYNITNSIDDFTTEFYVVPDEDDTKKDSDVSYILSEFTFDQDTFLYDTSLSYSIRELRFENFPFLIGSINESDVGVWKVSSIGYFQDTQFTFGGSGSGSSGGGHGSAGGYHDNLDKVNEKDVLVFDNYEVCSVGDISCHLDNIFQSIKDFFVRAGNFFINICELIWDGLEWLKDELVESNQGLFQGFKDFVANEDNPIMNVIKNNPIIQKIGDVFDDLKSFLKLLFIPEEDYFTSHFSDLNDGLHEKLGILIYPIDLLFDVFDRFNNLSNDSNGIINIPNIDVPGFGNLIKGRTFKINEYWAKDPFSTLYNIYLAFVHCFIGFCLYKLAVRKKYEILGGGY